MFTVHSNAHSILHNHNEETISGTLKEKTFNNQQTETSICCMHLKWNLNKSLRTRSKPESNLEMVSVNIEFQTPYFVPVKSKSRSDTVWWKEKGRGFENHKFKINNVYVLSINIFH